MEVRLMLDQAIKHQIIGQKVVSWQLSDRTKEDGDEYKNRGPNLNSLLFKGNYIHTITAISVRGRKLMIELESNGRFHYSKSNNIGKFNCIGYNFGLGSIMTWLPIQSDGSIAFPIPHRINQFWIFENNSMAWVLIDCTQFINMAYWYYYPSKQMKHLTFNEFGYYDPINNPQEWKLNLKKKV